MRVAARWQYYRRIFPAYLGSRHSQLSFWHETPAIHPRAFQADVRIGVAARPSVPPGEYYMLFREKADYPGYYDTHGLPLLDYGGGIGLQYNPIAIAQWGLGNYNQFCETCDPVRAENTLRAADWLCDHLEENSQGLWVWQHHFDWDYRDQLKAPWYSGLAQGQGVSLLLRAHAHAGDNRYLQTADRAFVALTRPIAEGGVLFEDEEKNLWIEEYLVSPPTHILNGFMWALWGVFDFWRARADPSARQIFERGVNTLVRNLSRFDTGYWSLYEHSGTRLKMLASPFYHQLHIVQLQVMEKLTGIGQFAEIAQRWQEYARHRSNRARALIAKAAFKLLHY
jgi:heparosan-N-sulfate-glucuronate 5-epimerase